jgi:hypothetical protein
MDILQGIYHTIRFETLYKWQDWHNASQAAANNPQDPLADYQWWRSLSCAAIGKDLHVIGLGLDGNLYHTIRFASSNQWQAWNNVSAHITNNPGSFGQVTCAAIGNDLHVIGLGAGGNLYHTIRGPKTRKTKWQAWDNASTSIANNPGMPTSPQCASVGNDLHVIGLIAGNLYHTIRDSNGHWQDWGDVSSQVPGYPGPFAFASCAGIGDNLHVVAGSAGKLYHTIRYASPSPYVYLPWQDWGNVSDQVAQNPGYIYFVDCAAIGNDLHVVVYNGGQLFHTIRPGSSYPWQELHWQPWGNVSEAAANDPQDPLPFDTWWRSLSCAGIENDLHVIGVATVGIG